ncbi:hypothetical protein Lgra_2981 [Legionella gratiana]|uniref:Uncharacterized protein n=1 Tax=Legionella gratiana TaxID=45066 RepID=A0A378J6R5_9GAMM|nr:hypothetical protein [Legionella gratiana]KTD06204.1 hypothetical protein Lgra_2981 [Legionella gratiana]STX43076.1 Uncharacterised protein [Legionella gratiana]
MYDYHTFDIGNDQDDNIALLRKLRTKLPRVMREQLNLKTQARAYFLLAMLSDDDCVHRLRDHLREQYKAPSSSTTPIEQALSLITQLQESPCNHLAPFKYRLPSFLGEYPIHSREINSKIKRFNQLIEVYHADEFAEELDAFALDQAYQDVLLALKEHYMGCNINSLWQLLQAMSAWSTTPIETFLSNYPYLLSSVDHNANATQAQSLPLSKKTVDPIGQPISANKKTVEQPFSSTFDYQINEAGRIADKSVYLSIHGFALKPGGHADALAKKIPDFLPWVQWQSNIRRQLSQLINLPLNDEFFDWLQTVLQRLGVEFITLKASSYECYVSPFLNHKIILNSLNEEMVLRILQEQCEQADITIEAAHLTIISRYLIRFLQRFQFNRGEALGIGANWGGVVSDANEAGVDAFRFNDPEWAAHFRNLSIHRQGPSEAHMNAAIGIKYELQALLSSFEYMTQLQPSEYPNTLYNALVDNLITGLFPEPPYFENSAYTKYRRHYAVRYTDDGMQQIDSFYQLDPQGTYFKTNKGDYKQTPMFRQAGSLVVESFPRDTGSSDCSQSLSVANPLWPLQLQYAQCSSTGMRGHLVYNPLGPDEFIPDAFYGQIIRESDDIVVPFIGVIPKNFDKHFKQVELCASFVIRMVQSSRLMTYCPAFSAYYSAIATRFLPPIDRPTPPLPSQTNIEINRKWQKLDKVLHDPQRTADVCQKDFFSLFKELIYSLYPLAQEDVDLHYYFAELISSPDAFAPQNRATCDRLIRELTTLKPLHSAIDLQRYERILNYLRELTDFFYPTPSDETAKAIAQQARLHVKPLLALPDVKGYFADLNKSPAANISPKVSPGLMYDALKYQAPSPAINRDFYSRRHATNFHSGYRDLEGNQIVRPSTREIWLDKVVKTGGALLPLIRRDKTIFSLLTQPFSQAYIAGYQKYRTQEHYRVLKAICSGIGGFVYGTGLGASHALSSIPRTLYNGFFASVIRQQKADHSLAISSAPSNEPGLRVQAIMDIRDHLLQCMATASGDSFSKEQLVNRLLTHVKKIHPSLLSGRVTKEMRYQQILLDAFPLGASGWQQLFEPVIDARNNKVLERLINKHALQIDNVLIYALYECLTAPNCEQNTDEMIKTIIDKHKLKEPQDKALTAFVFYYANNPEAKRQDIAQYCFNGTALAKLKEKEQGLRKIQTWMNNALDSQWGLETLFSSFMDQYKILLNQFTLADIVSELPDSMREVLQELLSRPGNEKQILKKYELDEPQKEFLLQCAFCYQSIASKEVRDSIIERARICESQDSSLSTKAREHLKLTQFVGREWHHHLLPMDSVQSIINEIKKQIAITDHPVINELSHLYEAVLQDSKSIQAFDAFYDAAMKIQKDYEVESPLHEWVNVTMNVLVNLLLDEITWTNEKQLINPLSNSQAIVTWLNHLMNYKHGVRALLVQQIEQAQSYDQAAWRCQHILHVLEESQPDKEYIHGTGMQKLLRVICQNSNTITTTGEQKAKEVPISVLCKYSITMQHALSRVREKIPDTDFVRPTDVTLKGF